MTESNISVIGITNKGFSTSSENVNEIGDPEKQIPKEEIQQTDDDEEDEVDRAQWGNPLEFLMSCIAMSVGLGNIWRFPFTAYENGGGAFLIPYIIILLFIGKPLYYLEMVLGQFSGYSNVKIWAMVPLMKGIGFAQWVATASLLSYYVVLMAISLFYFAMSFKKVLPWSVCGEWAGENCLAVDDDSSNFPSNMTLISSAEEYFMTYIMHAPDDDVGIDDGIGVPDWKLCLCLIGSWIAICAIILKGTQSSGKAAYVMALFPYVVLIILLVKGATLEGAVDGVLFFITPEWEKLYDPNVWFEAISQSFFSLTVGFGPITMYSSFNPFRHTAHRDSTIVSFMDTFTSLMAGFATFAILGGLAHTLGRPVEEVVKSGTGLSFISYPDAIARFDKAPQFFSVMFFLMMFSLGAGSAMALSSCCITIICDQFPKLNRMYVTIAFCACGIAAGIMFTTPGGLLLIDLIDFYGCNFVVYIMTMFEVFAVAWLYGIKRICLDIEFMLGHRPGFYWKVCWMVVIPVVLLVVVCYKFATWTVLTYGDDYVYPHRTMIAGWMLSGLAFGVFVGFGIHSIYKSPGNTVKEKFLNSLKPSYRWGPRGMKMKAKWELWNEERLGLNPTWKDNMGWDNIKRNISCQGASLKDVILCNTCVGYPVPEEKIEYTMAYDNQEKTEYM